MDFAPVVWMDIYNAWLALFEIFYLQWGLAFALGKPSRRRNNEFLNIRLVRMYKAPAAGVQSTAKITFLPRDTTVVPTVVVLTTIMCVLRAQRRTVISTSSYSDFIVKRSEF